MKLNLRLLLVVAVLFGISTGVYEYILPLYLDAQRISFQKIGVIFALAGLAMVIARIYMGSLADLWGRKPLYTWALILCGGATALTPFAPPLIPALIWQTLLKTFRELGSLTRETIYPVILYEEGATGFLNRISKFRGVEFLLQAGGTLLVGVAINVLGAGLGIYRLLFLVAGGLILISMMCWAVFFHEPARPKTQRIISLRELFSFDLHPNLRIILISGIIFTFGMQLSHSFFLQLFFVKTFPAAFPAVKDLVTWTSWILVLHRVTIALPLLIVGNLPLKNLRGWYIAGLIIEGVTLSASAVIPVFFWSAAVFLLHDLIGAGLWSPIQATLIQRYSRDETRGMEVGKVLAWSSLGAIFGPLAAGMLAEISTKLPFFFSGVMMILSAVPLIWLNTRAPRPGHAPAATPVTN